MGVILKNAEWCYCEDCGNYELMWLWQKRVCSYCAGRRTAREILGLKPKRTYLTYREKILKKYYDQMKKGKKL